jgi:hypothetical protein
MFDAVVYAKPDVMRALILGFSAAAEHMDHIVEHSMYPEKYWDDIHDLAKERGFEFVHPKYTKGPTLVKDQPTVH